MNQNSRDFKNDSGDIQPQGVQRPRMQRFRECIESEGALGLIGLSMNYFIKVYFTVWYRLRLHVGKGTSFTGKINLRGAKRIRIGSGCVIEKDATFQVGPRGSLVIGNRCFIATQTWLTTEGELEILDGTYVLKRSEISSSKKSSYGPKVWVARDCKIMADEVYANEGAIFGPGVYVIGGNHAVDPITGRVLMKAEKSESNFPIVLGAGCWLGSRAIILKGVKIGEGAVIGAGAVVTKDVEPFHLAVGSPANTVRLYRDRVTK